MMKKISIGYLSTMYHTSHIIKAKQWIESSMHMTPVWQLFPTGPAMVEAFAEGAIDIGYIGLPPAMIGMVRGIAIKCIAGGHVEGTVVIGGKQYQSLAKLHTIEQVLMQFKGQSLGTPTKGSIHDVIIRNLIDREGADVTIKNFSWADLIPEAIESGEIAGAAGTPPLAVISAQECASTIVIPPDKLWPYNPSYGIVVKETLLKEASILEDFLMLHERACNLIREAPEEAAASVSNEVKVVDPSFVIKAFQISPKYCAALTDSYLDSTIAFVEVLNKLGYIERQLTQDEIFDLSTIQRVHPLPDHYGDPGKLTHI
jgi:NitT/TauT family transport system substrate-binding protein